MSHGARPPPQVSRDAGVNIEVRKEMKLLNTTLDKQTVSKAGRSKEERPARSRVYNRVKVLRRASGLSREEVAGAVGISAATLGNLEREEYEPPLSLAWGLRDYFGLSMEAIFSLEPMPDLAISETISETIFHHAEQAPGASVHPVKKARGGKEGRG